MRYARSPGVATTSARLSCASLKAKATAAYGVRRWCRTGTHQRRTPYAAVAFAFKEAQESLADVVATPGLLAYLITRHFYCVPFPARPPQFRRIQSPDYRRRGKPPQRNQHPVFDHFPIRRLILHLKENRF